MSSALTKACLTFDERPRTPEDQRKYRRSSQHEPGKRFEHYGLADDYKTMQLSDKIYGKMLDGDATTAHSLINHKKPSELERINKMKAERNYVVNKR
jgi:hypothetical protein